MRPLLFLLALTACAKRVQDTTVDEVEVTTVRRAFANVHWVEAGELTLLVDTGIEAEADALVEQLRALGKDPAELDLIIAAHGHDDHAGGAATLRRASGAPVLLGAGDLPLASAGRNDAGPLCATDRIGRSRLEGVQEASYAPLEPTMRLEPGATSNLNQLLQQDGPPAAVYAIPGHTEGSLVVTVGNAVFVGDMFRGAIGVGGARVHFYQCDLTDNRADIERVLGELAPGGERFYTGHFGPLGRKDVERLVERMVD